MQLCKFCGKECKNSNSLRNHERLCKSNPNRQTANILAAVNAASKKSHLCSYCKESFSKGNIKKHESSCKANPLNKKVCPICDEEYSGDASTCSYSCANTLFRTGYSNGNWKGNSHRAIAKLHHDMKCVVCGEDKIVAIHHYDENHLNNEPNNLIPLCPTHHQYVHSKYRELVINKIEEYKLSFA